MRNFGIILMSHGKYAIEALNSAQMICGEIEGIKALGLDMNESKDQLKEKFDNAFNDLSNKYENVLCICDIYGGTPFNVVSEALLNGKNFISYTGLNLSMIIELAFCDEMNEEEIRNTIENVYTSSFIDVNEVIDIENNEDDDFDL